MAASAIEDSGNIFVPKMCEPVKIQDFAARMIREAGLEIPSDIEIVVTGLRPGDKLQEELAYAYEVLQPSSDERLYRANGQHREAQIVDAALQEISESVQERNLIALIGALCNLVPEYQPSETLLALLNPSLA